MKTMNTSCRSQVWDWNVTWYTDEPDFTECFKVTVLVWLPCLYFWLCLPLEIIFIRRSKARDIPLNMHNQMRLIAILIIVAVSFIKVIQLTYVEENLDIEWYSAMIQFITYIVLFCLAVGNIKHGIRSSGVLFTFSLLSLICGFPQLFALRNNMMMKVVSTSLYYTVTYIIYYISMMVIFISYCFMDAIPRYSLYYTEKNECPESQSTIISKLLYIWFDSLMWKGFRKELVVDDLWTLNYENTVECLKRKFKKLEKHYRAKSKNTPSTKEKPDTSEDESHLEKLYTICSIIRIFFYDCSIIFVCKFLEKICLFSLPVIFRCLINYIRSNEEHWHGYAYALMFLIICVAQNLLRSRFLYLSGLLGIRVNVGLNAVIYKKVLRISSGAREKFTTGEIMNLMSVDTEKFNQVFRAAGEMMLIPLEIWIISVYLWNMFGASILLVYALTGILLTIISFVTKSIKMHQLNVIKIKDKRIKLLNEALNGIKIVKLNAWETYFVNKIIDVRNSEIVILRKIAYCIALLFSILECTPVLVQTITLTTFYVTNSDRIPDATTIFVSTILFGLLKEPLQNLALAANLIDCSVSLERINKFLRAEELEENATLHYELGMPVTIQNGSFSWSSQYGSAVLQHINLKIDDGKLVAVVGPVGCGKSSLFQAILGELYKISGVVNLKGSVAYVPQQPWILNSTLRDNVIFGEKVTENFYNDVIESCALKQDIQLLPGGDLTEIGEKGINLSGGQKQRINIGRAICLQADIYLLDDPLSAVDSHVANHIFEKVIGPEGLLRKKTRIMATHSTTFLSKMDLIVVLKDGTISECGTYTELMDMGNDFAELLINYNSADSDDTNNSIDLLQNVKVKESSRFQNFETAKRNIGLKEMENDVAMNHIIKAEAPKLGRITMDVFKYYKSFFGSFSVNLLIVLFVISHLFRTSINIWLSVWISDPNIVSDGTQNVEKRNYYVTVLYLLTFFNAIFHYISDVSLFDGAAKASKKIHDNLVRKVLNWPMALYEMTPVGRILNRFSSDINVLEYIIALNIRHAMPRLFSTITSLAIVACIMPSFILVLIPVGVLLYMLQRYYITTSQQLKRLQGITKSPLFSQFGETVFGAQYIRANRREKKFILQCYEIINSNQAVKYLSIVATLWLVVRIENITNFVIFSAALFIVKNKETLNDGLVGLAMSSVLLIAKELSTALIFLTDVEIGFVSVERIKEYDQVEIEQDLYKDVKVLELWPSKGDIAFKDVTVRYRKDLPPVLKEITFLISSGQKVGVIGRTGSGKSTLVLCLLRAVGLIDGTIHLNGLDIFKIPLHVLRSRITIIPQEPVLFSGTIRDNLDPKNEHDDDELYFVLERTQLRRYVSELSDGIYSTLTEGGQNLSVGQRQLICLARALLRKTKVLILDEATAAIDMETDEFIQQTIRKEFNQCTIITVAHRINTVIDYDMIAVIDDGRLVEYDSPTALLNSKKTYFYQAAKEVRFVE